MKEQCKNAFEEMEQLRWGNEPRCPHCDSVNISKMLDDNGKRNKRFLWRCHDCKKQFTVRIGTVCEDSRLPLGLWLFALTQYELFGKINALEICHIYHTSYKSAWLMKHKILKQKAKEEYIIKRIKITENNLKHLKFKLSVEKRVLEILNKIIQS